MTNELISVIIPVYGVDKYVAKCIKSIMVQTYQNIEIIAVDDGSKDNCGSILDELALSDTRIKVIHQNNLGLFGSRRSGILMATGSYVMFVDGDDWIEPQTVEVLYNRAKQEDSDVTFGLYHSVDHNGKELSCSVFLHEYLSLDRDEYVKMMFESKISGSVCVKLYRRSLFTDQSITFTRDFSAAEDHLINCETFMHIKRAAGVPDVLYNYYMREDSLCHTSILSLEYYQDLYTLADQAMGANLALRYKNYHERMFLQIYVNVIISTLMQQHKSYCGSEPYHKALSLAQQHIVQPLPFKAKFHLFLARHPLALYSAARTVSLLKGRGWLRFTKISSLETNREW